MDKILDDPKLAKSFLEHISDIELLKVCSIDKNTWNAICDDEFLRTRLEKKYPTISQYKRKDQTWKDFFLKVIYYASKMKEKFDFTYHLGNPKQILHELYTSHPRQLLWDAMWADDLDLVKYSTRSLDIEDVKPVYKASVHNGRVDISNYLKNKYNL